VSVGVHADDSAAAGDRVRAWVDDDVAVSYVVPAGDGGGGVVSDIGAAREGAAAGDVAAARVTVDEGSADVLVAAGDDVDDLWDVVPAGDFAVISGRKSGVDVGVAASGVAAEETRKQPEVKPMFRQEPGGGGATGVGGDVSGGKHELYRRPEGGAGGGSDRGSGPSAGGGAGGLGCGVGFANPFRTWRCGLNAILQALRAVPGVRAHIEARRELPVAGAICRAFEACESKLLWANCDELYKLWNETATRVEEDTWAWLIRSVPGLSELVAVQMAQQRWDQGLERWVPVNRTRSNALAFEMFPLDDELSRCFELEAGFRENGSVYRATCVGDTFAVFMARAPGGTGPTPRPSATVTVFGKLYYLRSVVWAEDGPHEHNYCDGCYDDRWFRFDDSKRVVEKTFEQVRGTASRSVMMARAIYTTDPEPMHIPGPLVMPDPVYVMQPPGAPQPRPRGPRPAPGPWRTTECPFYAELVPFARKQEALLRILEDRSDERVQLAFRSKNPTPASLEEDVRAVISVAGAVPDASAEIARLIIEQAGASGLLESIDDAVNEASPSSALAHFQVTWRAARGLEPAWAHEPSDLAMAAASDDVAAVIRLVGRKDVNTIEVPLMNQPVSMARWSSTCTLLDVAVSAGAVNVAKHLMTCCKAKPDHRTMMMAIASRSRELCTLISRALPSGRQTGRLEFMKVAADYHVDRELRAIWPSATDTERELFACFAIERRLADALILGAPDGHLMWSARGVALAREWPAVANRTCIHPSLVSDDNWRERRDRADGGWWVDRDGSITPIAPTVSEGWRVPEGIDRGQIYELVLPPGVTSIGEEGLAGCTRLTSLMLHGGVTSLGARACRGCCRLVFVMIPSADVSIGEGAFDGCPWGRRTFAVNHQHSADALGKFTEQQQKLLDFTDAKAAAHVPKSKTIAELNALVKLVVSVAGARAQSSHALARLLAAEAKEVVHQLGYARAGAVRVALSAVDAAIERSDPGSAIAGFRIAWDLARPALAEVLHLHPADRDHDHEDQVSDDEDDAPPPEVADAPERDLFVRDLAAAVASESELDEVLASCDPSQVVVGLEDLPERLDRRPRQCSLLDVAFATRAEASIGCLLPFCACTRETLRMAVSAGVVDHIRFVMDQLDGVRPLLELLEIAAEFHRLEALDYLLHGATNLEREMFVEFVILRGFADAFRVVLSGGYVPWPVRSHDLATRRWGEFAVRDRLEAILVEAVQPLGSDGTVFLASRCLEIIHSAAQRKDRQLLDDLTARPELERLFRGARGAVGPTCDDRLLASIRACGGWPAQVVSVFCPRQDGGERGHLPRGEPHPGHGEKAFVGRANGIDTVRLLRADDPFMLERVAIEDHVGVQFRTGLDPGHPMYVFGSDPWTIAIAAFEGATDCVAELLQGPNAELANELVCGACAGGRTGMLNECEALGLYLDVTSESGGTPASYAARFGQVEVLRWLHARGLIHVNPAPASEPVEFLAAAAGGHDDVINYLFQLGMRFVTNSVGPRAIEAALENGHLETARLCATLGATACRLGRAVCGGSPVCVAWQRALGVRVTAFDLALAAEQADADVMRVLLDDDFARATLGDAAVVPNAVVKVRANRCARDPMCVAIQHRNLACVELLAGRDGYEATKSQVAEAIAVAKDEPEIFATVLSHYSMETAFEMALAKGVVEAIAVAGHGVAITEAHVMTAIASGSAGAYDFVIGGLPRWEPEWRHVTAALEVDSVDILRRVGGFSAEVFDAAMSRHAVRCAIAMMHEGYRPTPAQVRECATRAKNDMIAAVLARDPSQATADVLFSAVREHRHACAQAIVWFGAPVLAGHFWAAGDDDEMLRILETAIVTPSDELVQRLVRRLNGGQPTGQRRTPFSRTGRPHAEVRGAPLNMNVRSAAAIGSLVSGGGPKTQVFWDEFRVQSDPSVAGPANPRQERSFVRILCDEFAVLWALPERADGTTFATLYPAIKALLDARLGPGTWELVHDRNSCGTLEDLGQWCRDNDVTIVPWLGPKAQDAMPAENEINAVRRLARHLRPSTPEQLLTYTAAAALAVASLGEVRRALLDSYSLRHVLMAIAGGGSIDEFLETLNGVTGRARYRLWPALYGRPLTRELARKVDVMLNDHVPPRRIAFVLEIRIELVRWFSSLRAFNRQRAPGWDYTNCEVVGYGRAMSGEVFAWIRTADGSAIFPMDREYLGEFWNLRRSAFVYSASHMDIWPMVAFGVSHCEDLGDVALVEVAPGGDSFTLAIPVDGVPISLAGLTHRQWDDAWNPGQFDLADVLEDWVATIVPAPFTPPLMIFSESELTADDLHIELDNVWGSVYVWRGEQAPAETIEMDNVTSRSPAIVRDPAGAVQWFVRPTPRFLAPGPGAPMAPPAIVVPVPPVVIPPRVITWWPLAKPPKRVLDLDDDVATLDADQRDEWDAGARALRALSDDLSFLMVGFRLLWCRLTRRAMPTTAEFNQATGVHKDKVPAIVKELARKLPTIFPRDFKVAMMHERRLALEAEFAGNDEWNGTITRVMAMYPDDDVIVAVARELVAREIAARRLPARDRAPPGPCPERDRAVAALLGLDERQVRSFRGVLRSSGLGRF
jgi:hypothetical protein